MSAEEVKQRALLLAQRICEHLPIVERSLPASGEKLLAEIKKCLIAASDKRLLQGGQREVFRLLKHESSVNSFVIIGGGNRDGGSQKDLKRQNQSVWFKRDDGALFTFSLIVIKQREGLVLHSYDFELWIPESASPVFIRFDLNSPNHNNEKDGMRSHLHPGHDDLSVPCPLLGPIEALEMLLYSSDLRFPEKRRSQPNALKNFSSEVTAYLARNKAAPNALELPPQTRQTLDKIRDILHTAKGPAIDPLRLAAHIVEKYAEMLLQDLSGEE